MGLDGSLFDPFRVADTPAGFNARQGYRPPGNDGGDSKPESGGSASNSGANGWSTHALGSEIAPFDPGSSGHATAFFDSAFVAGTEARDPGGAAAGGVLLTYRAGPWNGRGYNIRIDFKGSGWTPGLQTAFIHAADYFTTVITDDLPASNAFTLGGRFIDDLYIKAEVSTIDGEGGVLGQAGPSSTWTQTQLTASGRMQFDVADANSFYQLGLWDDIVTHEMMHVLGFGSLWNVGNHHLVDNNASGQPEFYTGAKALAAFRDDPVYGDPNALYIPVETDGGPGTAGAHWDEDTLANELMTGFIGQASDPLGPNVLSKFSVMSLADLGYTVGNYQPYVDLPAPIV